MKTRDPLRERNLEKLEVAAEVTIDSKLDQATIVMSVTDLDRLTNLPRKRYWEGYDDGHNKGLDESRVRVEAAS
jgi:hypothetical protein